MPRRAIGAVCLCVLAAAERAEAQTPAPSGGDLFAPLTNLFSQAALSLSGAFGLTYATQYVANVCTGERFPW